MSGRVRFYLNGTLEAVDRPRPTGTLLEFLRYRKGRTGTKEGCAEGDCGACTVVVGERLKEDRTAYRAVNSCILFLPALDGKAIVTVEGLAQPDGRLHPVQQALVDSHGSQCGFCTPGIVMSLHAHYLSGGPCDPQSLNTVLAGNLCRCTGYGPILAAGAAMQGYEAPALDGMLAAGKLAALAREDMLEYERTDPPERFLAPRSLAELCAVMARYPDATLLAGGTDVGLWVTKQHRSLETVVYLGAVPELKTVEATPAAFVIGAGVRYAELLEPLGAEWPDFGLLIERLGAVQVRNLGTMGGNIANGSPIGDSLPVLIALGAEMMLRGPSAVRRLPVEAYFLSYGRQDRRPGEFIERIVVPRARPSDYFRCYKISKRFDQDISAVCAAFKISRAGGVVREARVAYGGMAETPKRARACEAALRGKPWTLETVRQAGELLEKDFRPISDFRATAGYRMDLAKSLLVKAFLEDGTGSPIRVFAR